MAKKNVRDEPLKPQVTENEQMSDIVLILDKMELLFEYISDIMNRSATLPPTASIEAYRELLPDKWHKS